MLRDILETKRAEVEQLKASTTLGALLEQARCNTPPRPFRRALAESERPVSVIAEVKKASPSKGLIRPDFDPVAIAREYEAAGAEAVSVLTDLRYFLGSLDYLRKVREAISLPLLRKDFVIDEWQVVESRAYGADAVLLIAAALDGETLRHLFETACSLGMEALIEVHDERELEMVFRWVEPTLIGINNRDLRTFRTDLNTTVRLAAMVPRGVTVISESGIASPEDIALVKEAGARAVLVGEHFMRQRDVRRAVTDLVGERPARFSGGRT